jgi:hypothetical protein
VNISSLGLPEVADGSNVTLQFVQDGSDGSLYQVSRIFFSAASRSRSLTTLRLVYGLDPLLEFQHLV